MFQLMTNHKRFMLKLGSAALAVGVGIAPAWAQNEAAPASAQPKESSVLLPPPTPPQGNAASAQTTNNGQPSKDVFLQPSGQANQGQVNQTSANVDMPQPATSQSQALIPPQPPMRNDASIRQTSDRPQLGVYVVPTTGAGVRISSITQGTAAAAAGLQAGDIVLAMNGKTVSDPQDVIGGVQQMRVGDQVELRIWRNGQEQTITATLQAMRDAPIAMESAPSNGFIESSVIPYSYSPGTVVRSYSYPGRYYSNYPSYGYQPYGYYGGGGYYGSNRYYGSGYGGAYYGTPSFGYYRSPWGGQGVRVGSFGFGWR